MTADEHDDTRILSEFKSPDTSRAGLDFACRQHMLWLQAAIEAGIPADELAHDLAAFHSAASHLIALYSASDADAPTWLGDAI
jgi:hypothetical protein